MRQVARRLPFEVLTEPEVLVRCAPMVIVPCAQEMSLHEEYLVALIAPVSCFRDEVSVFGRAFDRDHVNGGLGRWSGVPCWSALYFLNGAGDGRSFASASCRRMTSTRRVCGPLWGPLRIP